MITMIKELINDYGYTQSKLARELGVSRKTLSFWVNEKSNPSRANMAKLRKIHQERKKLVQGSLLNVTGNKEVETKVTVQGILYNGDDTWRVGEKSDDESFYKNEMADKRRADYYRGKKMALILEETNNNKLILFPSLGGAEGEWYKMGGASALLYKYRIGPRMGRKPKIKRDSDKRERFTDGITSIHWLTTFIEAMRDIGLKDYVTKEYGIVLFELQQCYSGTEIKEMRAQLKRERELFQDMIKPSVSYPEIYAHFLQLVRILPVKVRKMEAVGRDMFGARLNHDLVEIGSLYYRLAEGRTNKEIAREKMLDCVGDMMATLIIIDEAGLMPDVGVFRLGTVLTDLKEAIGKMFEKKDSGEMAIIGSKLS